MKACKNGPMDEWMNHWLTDWMNEWMQGAQKQLIRLTLWPHSDRQALFQAALLAFPPHVHVDLATVAVLALVHCVFRYAPPEESCNAHKQAVNIVHFVYTGTLNLASAVYSQRRKIMSPIHIIIMLYSTVFCTTQRNGKSLERMNGTPLCPVPSIEYKSIDRHRGSRSFIYIRPDCALTMDSCRGHSFGKKTSTQI